MRREAFLRRAAERLARSAPRASAHAPAPAPATIPTVRYRDPLDDPVAALVGAVTRLGGEARAVDDRELGALVDRALELAGPGPVALSADPEVARALPHLERHGVELLPPGAPVDLAGAVLGITGAAGAIARTGTVVVDAARAGGRSASLLPPVHLALVEADTVVPDPSAWWRRMREHHPDGPPSQLVFITGPSKSADIELTLTMGVHGPGRLLVGILR